MDVDPFENKDEVQEKCKSKKKKIKLGKITRNPFLNFVRECRRRNPKLSIFKVVKLAAKLWNKMTDRQKKKYKCMACSAPAAKRYRHKGQKRRCSSKKRGKCKHMSAGCGKKKKGRSRSRSRKKSCSRKGRSKSRKKSKSRSRKGRSGSCKKKGKKKSKKRSKSRKSKGRSKSRGCSKKKKSKRRKKKKSPKMPGYCCN